MYFSVRDITKVTDTCIQISVYLKADIMDLPVDELYKLVFKCDSSTFLSYL